MVVLVVLIVMVDAKVVMVVVMVVVGMVVVLLVMVELAVLVVIAELQIFQQSIHWFKNLERLYNRLVGACSFGWLSDWPDDSLAFEDAD